LANVVGKPVRRKEDPRFITGQGRYVDDIRIPGAMHVTFVRSPWAHARINGIDASDATALPGVQVFTAKDIELGKEPLPAFVPVDERWYRPFLASDKVRFAGEIVAAVLAPTRERSVDAAELVAVDYEPLPVVTDPREALQNEVLLFEDTGTNVCLERPAASTDDELFEGCEVVASGTLTSQRIAACPIEPRAAAAQVEDDDRLTVWLSTQTPHQDRGGLAAILGTDPALIRVVAPDVGGGFGGKGLNGEYILVAYLARATGTPVRWTETRTENLIALPHGRAQRIAFRIGGRRDGTIEALRLSLLQDAGAYPSVGAALPNLTGLMASGVYRIPKIDVDLKSVVTNTTSTAAVRGAGRPEATQGVERAIDAFASELELDPAEVRRRNFIPNDAFPYQTASGATYDIGDYGGALDRVLQAAGYEQLRAEQAARRGDPGAKRLLGIGLSTYVEITNGIGESEFGAVEITHDGQAIVRTGSFSQGQGHETTFAQIVADRLGLDVEQVTVLKGDTDTIARGTGTYGSKSTQIGGVAASKASDEVVERGKRLAAEELEASPEDMVLDLEAGRFHVAGSPEPGLNWRELAERLAQRERLNELSAEVDFQAPQPTFPFGAHLAVVEVDLDTGSVSLERFVAVDDAGTIINPLVFEGQVHGGVAAGIAQALFEEIAYDEDGNPLNANLVSYCIPGATELPSFELVDMETPTPVNPLGAKGIGEAGTIGATPAVHAAVLDALRPLGVRELEMPLGSERVWRAIHEAAEARGHSS
jgi:carbon-monoxide dehydrogenase large subunit